MHPLFGLLVGKKITSAIHFKICWKLVFLKVTNVYQYVSLNVLQVHIVYYTYFIMFSAAKTYRIAVINP